MAKRTCSIDGCGRPSRKRTWCQTHYTRWQDHGDPNHGGPIRQRGTPMQRFVAKVDVGECWLWTGSLTHDGYGRFHVDGRTVVAHRWLYQQLVRPLDDAETLDHLCRVRRCCNPDHVEPVDVGTNTLRGYGLSAQNARKDTCKRGHLLTPDNLYVYDDGRRSCRECMRMHWREEKRRTRAAA